MYPNSGSRIETRINSGLSTQIVIKVENVTVGAIQRLTVTQNRGLYIREEIGTDGIVEIHPRGSTKFDISVNRIVFDGMRLPEAFARAFINIHSQRFPFDIHIIDRSNTPEIVNTLHNCWFSLYSPTFSSDDFIVAERATLKCEYITTTQSGLSAVNGGLRGIDYEHDSIEKDTDIHGKRGRYI